VTSDPFEQAFVVGENLPFIACVAVSTLKSGGARAWGWT
jgi:hypothetical protein